MRSAAITLPSQTDTMDSKTFTARLAKTLGCDHQRVSAMTAALTAALAETGAELDSAAIPGFGTFQTVKTDEHITVDPVSGERLLVPPAITMHFLPSVVLRKKMRL